MAAHRRPSGEESALLPAETNGILASLPDAELDRMQPALRRMSFKPKQSLQRAGQAIETVYFPWSGVCSVVATLTDGRTAELITVGREGIVGHMTAFGQRLATHDAMVQIPVPASGAYAIGADDFQLEFNRGGALQQAVHRYAVTEHTFLGVTVACNALHSAAERCARWLLIAQDQVGSPRFDLSHEFLATMLGVRRPTATIVAGTMQAAGLIRYRRGHMEILDREALEQASCECYNLVRDPMSPPSAAVG